MLEPPRRHSIDEDVKLPTGDRIGPRIAVLLNGNAAQRVVAYDCDEGWIERVAEDADGRPYLNGARDCVVREKVYGAVTVCWRKPDA